MKESTVSVALAASMGRAKAYRRIVASCPAMHRKLGLFEQSRRTAAQLLLGGIIRYCLITGQPVSSMYICAGHICGRSRNVTCTNGNSNCENCGVYPNLEEL